MEWIILLVPLAVGAFFIARAVQKRSYVKELETLGWTFVDQPSISVAYGLNNPPFGFGTERSVDDQIVGRSANGTSFQAFRYSSSVSKDGGYVVTMRLPAPLPEFYIFPPNRQRPLIQGLQLETQPHTVVAADETYGCAVQSAISGAVAAMAATSPVDLSIDHNQLVAINAPRKIPELRAFIELLTDVRDALARADLSTWPGEPAPGHLSFYKRSSWIYEPRNDAFLSYVEVSGGGSNHRAVDIVHCPEEPLRFVALTHKWETQSTSTDSNGNTTTSTQHHSEAVMEFQFQFAFRQLCVNRGAGERVHFESEAFNKAFWVRTAVPRFASDVMHPRQLEYLLRTRPYPFEITPDNRIVVSVPSTGPEVIDFMTTFMRGFFGRVPDFTWKELGTWPRPVPEVENYSV